MCVSPGIPAEVRKLVSGLGEGLSSEVRETTIYRISPFINEQEGLSGVGIGGQGGRGNKGRGN